MSVWTDWRDAAEAKLAAFATWWEGTAIGQEIDNAAAAAKAELEKISEQDLTTIAEATATGVLTGLANGGTAGAVAAGITAAETAFKAAAADVSKQTITTFASTIANQVAANQNTPTPNQAAAA